MLYDLSRAFKVNHGTLHQILTNGAIGTELQPSLSAQKRMAAHNSARQRTMRTMRTAAHHSALQRTAA
jgi:hypothetical protein